MVAFVWAQTFVVYIVLLSILFYPVGRFACMFFDAPGIPLFSYTYTGYTVVRPWIVLRFDVHRSGSANEGPKVVCGNESDQLVGDGKYGESPLVIGLTMI